MSKTRCSRRQYGRSPGTGDQHHRELPFLALGRRSNPKVTVHPRFKLQIDEVSFLLAGLSVHLACSCLWCEIEPRHRRIRLL